MKLFYLRNQHSAKYFAGFPIGFNIVVGGVDEQGNDFSNDLSELFLSAQRRFRLPQPNLSVRLHEKTNDKLLKHAIRVVAKGSGMPQFFNDKAIIKEMENLDSNSSRCYELCYCWRNNLGWSDAAMFNMNKVLELTLNHGRCLLTDKQMAPDLVHLALIKLLQI